MWAPYNRISEAFGRHGHGIAHPYCLMARLRNAFFTGTKMPTLYELIGGQPVVDNLVDTFYRRMDTLPEAATIRAMHAPDLSHVNIVLKKYLGEWLGGPNLYSSERGHPRLRMRHLPFRIGEAERDAWLLCMRGALEETVTAVEIREPIYEKLSALADWMRNQPVG
jgi:hemoglobin